MTAFFYFAGIEGEEFLIRTSNIVGLMKVLPGEDIPNEAKSAIRLYDPIEGSGDRGYLSSEDFETLAERLHMLTEK
jgi:hypothetical protein